MAQRRVVPYPPVQRSLVQFIKSARYAFVSVFVTFLLCPTWVYYCSFVSVKGRELGRNGPSLLGLALK